MLASAVVREVAAAADAEHRELRTRWQSFWRKRSLIDYNTVYCILASESKDAKVDRLDDTRLHGAALEHVMAAQLAYLAWEGHSFEEKPTLPGTWFSPKALFMLIHCHIGCTRGVYSIGERCMVLLRNWGTFTTRLPPIAWFAQVEAQLYANGVSSQLWRFLLVEWKLPGNVLGKLELDLRKSNLGSTWTTTGGHCHSRAVTHRLTAASLRQERSEKFKKSMSVKQRMTYSIYGN
ncbi:uncharacterized protein LOC144119869 [Amblyomma americanum]